MKFIPSSPTLMNANTNGERIGTLSSCFIMGIEDSLSGIFDAVKECAIVTGKSGGVGYDFSSLRSSNEGVKSTGGKVSSGPLSFIDIFNSTLDGVQQGGSRRGAGMSMLSCFSENTSILTDKGWINIVDLINRIYNEDIYAITEDNQLFLITDGIINPPEEIYEIEGENGEIIEVTPSHQFIIYNKKTKKEYLKKIGEINPEIEYMVYFKN
jgi:ribonucleotide reductase alpha subunit